MLEYLQGLKLGFYIRNLCFDLSNLLLHARYRHLAMWETYEAQ